MWIKLVRSESLHESVFHWNNGSVYLWNISCVATYFAFAILHLWDWFILFYPILFILLCSLSHEHFDYLCRSLHGLVQFGVTYKPSHITLLFVNNFSILKKHPLTPELDLLFLGINIIKSPVKSICLTGPICSVYIWIYKILINDSKCLIISIWLHEAQCL